MFTEIDNLEVTVEKHTCNHHKKHPFDNFTGCTCNGSYIGKIAKPNVSPKTEPWAPPTTPWDNGKFPSNPIQGNPIICPHCKQLVGYDSDYMYYCGYIHCKHCGKLVAGRPIYTL